MWSTIGRSLWNAIMNWVCCTKFICRFFFEWIPESSSYFYPEVSAVWDATLESAANNPPKKDSAHKDVSPAHIIPKNWKEKHSKHRDVAHLIDALRRSAPPKECFLRWLFQPCIDWLQSEVNHVNPKFQTHEISNKHAKGFGSVGNLMGLRNNAELMGFRI